MAIRIKEWAIAPAPVSAPTVPMSGVESIGRAGEAMARGFSGLGQGLSEMSRQVLLLEDRWNDQSEEIKQKGECLEADNKLKVAIDESLNEMLRLNDDASDRRQTWERLARSKVQEVLSPLSEGAQRTMIPIAEQYMAAGFAEATKRRSLASLQQARGRWKDALNIAVAKGDPNNVETALLCGKGVFVSEEDWERTRARAMDEACLSRWERLWKDDPVQAALSEKQKNDLPQTKYFRRRLDSENQKKLSALHTTFVRLLVDSERRGDALSEKSLQFVESLGFMDKEQAERYRKTHDHEGEYPVSLLSDEEKEQWREKIDLADEDDASYENLCIGIASSGLRQEERLKLFDRLDTMRQVPKAEREKVYNIVNTFFKGGCLGDPGDPSVKKARELRIEQLLMQLRDKKADEVAESFRKKTEGFNEWIDFSKNK